MTREERKIALYCLKASSDYHSEVCEECINYPNCDHTIQDDVTETIIKALEQEPCEDAISRQAVLNTLDKMDSVLDEDRTVETYKELLIACYNDLPSATPTRKKGKWINKSQKSGCGITLVASECTCCGMKTPFDCDNFIYRYCPNCGAEME